MSVYQLNLQEDHLQEGWGMGEGQNSTDWHSPSDGRLRGKLKLRKGVVCSVCKAQEDNLPFPIILHIHISGSLI